MIDTPKGERIPQTVENLLEIMAADAQRMLAMDREIKQLKDANNRLRARVLKLRQQRNPNYNPLQF